MAEKKGHGAPAPSEGGVDREVSVRAVVGFAIFLFLLIAFALGLMWVVSRVAKKEIASRQAPPPPLAGARENPLPPAPRLEISPPKDLAALRDREDAVMKTYAWVDRAKGIAEVPVDRAIEIAIEKGLPVRYGPAPAAPQDQGTAGTGTTPVKGKPERVRAAK
ncbi:MAG: hypothetical protein ACM3JH_07755 [Acidithiobacillales bacterium]